MIVRRMFLAILALVFCCASAAFVTAQSAYADDGKSDEYSLTPSEEEALINETAKGFELLWDASSVDSKGNITAVDADKLNQSLREQGLYIPYGRERSWETFGHCVAKKIGITDVKEFVRIVFDKKTKQLLKSKAWKKASAYVVQKLRKMVGKKWASAAVKKIAKKLLPGGMVGELAFGLAVCGGKEAWRKLFG